MVSGAAPGAVWLVTGAQGAGKSTVADHLARRFERGVHVRGGQFYRWVVQGWVHWDHEERADEARRLLDLRYRLATTVADEYADAGFTCVVQDNIYGLDVVQWFARLRTPARHLVVLRPSVDVVIARHDERQRATGKVAYTSTYTPAQNDADVASIPGDLGGLWLDTSQQTPEETVDEIVGRRDESVVTSVPPSTG